MTGNQMNVVSTLLTVLCVRLPTVSPAPPAPRLPALQRTLQQQLMELQTMQQLSLTPPYGLSQPQPYIILLPDQPINTNHNNIQTINDGFEHDSESSEDTGTGGDEDSVVVDAEPGPSLRPLRALLLVPNARLSIGGIISALPFLPIEINVPDSIAWAYNGISSGISSIISIIGSRLPFRSPQEEPSMKNVNLKSIMSGLQMKTRNNIRPIVMMASGELARLVSPFVL